MHDAHISRMKYFEPLENISSYLYMLHMCFKHMTFMCKKHKFMKEQLHNFHYQIVGWEICDEHPTTLEPLTCDKGLLEFIHI
jgi:hypothetical protein